MKLEHICSIWFFSDSPYFFQIFLKFQSRRFASSENQKQLKSEVANQEYYNVTFCLSSLSRFTRCFIASPLHQAIILYSDCHILIIMIILPILILSNDSQHSLWISIFTLIRRRHWKTTLFIIYRKRTTSLTKIKHLFLKFSSK